MVDAITGNRATAFVQQPTDEMKAKLAADARVNAEREAPAEIKAKSEKRFVEFERAEKLGRLEMLEAEKQFAIKRAKDRADLMAHYEKMALTPPEPAQTLEGDEAKRMLRMAEEQAKKHGSPVPPQKGSRFGFFEGDFLYRVYSDGSITRQKKDVPTPEEQVEYRQVWEEQKVKQESFVVENAAETADYHRQQTELLSQLGLTEDEWRRQRATSNNVSIEA